uniref:Uncharacterized protein MANES_14G101800 n=1 Tax=Rhizophora mucronata TaxID=61149 RepID=A0A2P2IPD0_RHIMU
MSACFDLAVIGTLLKAWLSSSTIANRSFCCDFMRFCCAQQGLNLGFLAVSMRLRPKRYLGICFFVFF